MPLKPGTDSHLLEWMKLSEAAELLAARLEPPEAGDEEIRDLSCHPDHVAAGDCFGVFGEYFEYNQWYDPSMARLAACRVQPRAVLTDQPLEGYRGAVLRVGDARHAFGLLARAFYGMPDGKLPVIAVTGTNGKTTTTHLVAHLLDRVAGSSGSMGTLGCYRNGIRWQAGEFTTGLALWNYEMLRRFAECGTAGVGMEVSSHGLALDRVAGMRFRVGVLTNVARDHLDFHGSQEKYVQAKERLFRELRPDATAVLNADDACAERFAAATDAEVIRYGWHPRADWRVVEADFRRDGADVALRVDGAATSFSTRLVGRFQVANVLAAAAAVAALGFAVEDVLRAVADFCPVSGRMEAIPLASGATAIVDYAHNPDGLENLLVNCRAMQPRRVLLVFGCGGDRDRGKRPLMGEIAAKGADCIWVTSDNPRTEDPLRIIEDILQGMPAGVAPEVEPDRAAAIRKAHGACRAGDLLVVAGKGHEDYQIVGDVRIPFSDQAWLRSLDAAEAG